MPIVLRRRQDTKTNWDSENPVIPDRQLVFTKDGGGTGIPLIKIGDGSSQWDALPYINKRNNFTATTDPTSGNDQSQNYSVGSMWLNTVDETLWVLVSFSSGADWVTVGELIASIDEIQDVPVKPNDGYQYVLVEENGVLTWESYSGAGGLQDLNETLYEGNTTGGIDIELSDGDVIDVQTVDGDIVSFQGGFYIYYNAANIAFIMSSLGVGADNGTDYDLAFKAQSDGTTFVGGNGTDGDFRIVQADDFYVSQILTTLTANRTITLPDGDIDWVTGGATGYVLTQQSDGSFALAAQTGEANTASNVGGGNEVFKQKTGVDLEFRTLVAGSNVTITENADTIEIASTGGGGGGGEDLSETLYNGNITDGYDIVISDGDKIDWSNATNGDTLASFPDSALLLYRATGGIEWRVDAFTILTTGAVQGFSVDPANGRIVAGSPSKDGTIRFYDTSSGFYFDFLAPDITANRVLVFPDGDIRFDGASDADVLTWSSSLSRWVAAPAPSGSGDVTGPSTSTDNALVRWDGTGGDTIQDSGVTLDDSDNLSGVNNVTGTDTDFVTGTAGTSGNLVQWDVNGDAVDSGVSSSDFGDVDGPSTSTDNAIVRFDGTGGSTIQDSGVLIDDNDNVSGANEVEAASYSNATIETLDNASGLTPDLADSNFFTYTLTGNETLNIPDNLRVCNFQIKFVQDGTGSRTLSFDSAYLFPGGTAPTLSTAANSVDIITGFCDGTNVYIVSSLDFQTA